MAPLCDVMRKHFLNMFSMIIVQVIDPILNMDRGSKLLKLLTPKYNHLNSIKLTKVPGKA